MIEIGSAQHLLDEGITCIGVHEVKEILAQGFAERIIFGSRMNTPAGFASDKVDANGATTLIVSHHKALATGIFAIPQNSHHPFVTAVNALTNAGRDLSP